MFFGGGQVFCCDLAPPAPRQIRECLLSRAPSRSLNARFAGAQQSSFVWPFSFLFLLNQLFIRNKRG